MHLHFLKSDFFLLKALFPVPQQKPEQSAAKLMAVSKGKHNDGAGYTVPPRHPRGTYPLPHLTRSPFCLCFLFSGFWFCGTVYRGKEKKENILSHSKNRNYDYDHWKD